MNGHMKAHGKHMLIGGIGIAVLAVAFGAGWQQAVTWGLLLACPVGMIGMMWFMGRNGAVGHQHGEQAGADHSACHDTASAPAAQRVNEPVVPGVRPGA